jgi:predicted small secreted protein
MATFSLLTRTVSRPSVVVALALSVSACATGRGVARSVPDAAPAEPASAEGPSVGQGSIVRLLVRRASMLLEVDDPELTSRRITAMTASLGGYVERSRESSGGGVHITVRVPATTLEAAMDSVALLGKVERRQISADDVTEQVLDLEGLVATRRAIRDRLRQLLDRAQSIQDVITVERELARVQGELDGLERRLAYLRGSSSMAELSVEARKERILGPIGMVVAAAAWLLEKSFIIR